VTLRFHPNTANALFYNPNILIITSTQKERLETWRVLKNIPHIYFIIIFLHFEPCAQNGLLSALPYLLMWLFSIAVGHFSEWARKREVLSATAIRKICNSMGTLIFDHFVINL
jgi:hypothetical protein